jgi:hypothetical protein
MQKLRQGNLSGSERARQGGVCATKNCQQAEGGGSAAGSGLTLLTDAATRTSAWAIGRLAHAFHLMLNTAWQVGLKYAAHK